MNGLAYIGSLGTPGSFIVWKLLAFAVDTLELHLLSVKREKDGEKLKIDLMNLPRPGYPWSTPGSALPTI